MCGLRSDRLVSLYEIIAQAQRCTSMPNGLAIATVLGFSLAACSSYPATDLTAQLPVADPVAPVDQTLVTETLATLPDGDYLLISAELIEDMPENYKRTHLRKTGDRVVGMHLQYPDDNPCFQGTIDGNGVVNVAIAQPFYQAQEWRMVQVDRLDFAGYQKDAEVADAPLIDFCASRFN